MNNENLAQKIIAIIPDRLSLVIMFVTMLGSIIGKVFFSKENINHESFLFGFVIGFTLPAFILYYRKRKILKEYTKNTTTLIEQ